MDFLCSNTSDLLAFQARVKRDNLEIYHDTVPLDLWLSLRSGLC